MTYANTSTRVSWSGSTSCCTDISVRNSLKDTLQLVLSTETVFARAQAWSAAMKEIIKFVRFFIFGTSVSLYFIQFLQRCNFDSVKQVLLVCLKLGY